MIVAATAPLLQLYSAVHYTTVSIVYTTERYGTGPSRGKAILGDGAAAHRSPRR